MAQFEPALQLVLKHEGGFTDNPSDDGEATNLGISLRFYRKRINADATVSDIQNLTINDAAAIYKQFFWDKQSFEEIIDQHLASRVFDLQVNTGQGVTLLQKAVNQLSPNEHLVIDGGLGPKTLQAVNNLNAYDLYAALIAQAQTYYKHILEQHPQDAVFYHGWINRLSS